ncbi:MAG: hypothetical protein JW746_07960 [Candidatus Krumholzibacteriota bacterium]|nr:hypothetical protein [Candidatus Krumholzibacteriota bacterium]
MNDTERSAARMRSPEGIRGSLHDFLKIAVDKGAVDSVLAPVKVPAENSYAWILMNDPAVIESASPVAPVMPVQGAKALKSLTRKGKGESRILAVMRPCEIRAGIELMKLNQVHFDNIVLVSYDCPGAVPFQDYVKDPGFSEESFGKMIASGRPGEENIKPACGICTEFSIVDSDIHFGYFGVDEGSAFVIPVSEQGAELLDAIGLDRDAKIADWESEISSIRDKRTKKRTETLSAAGERIKGLDGLINAFRKCIGCHNCMSVCPICYCRQCYFDSEVSKKDPDFIFEIAEKRGAMAFPRDKVMFHAGRMTHMSLSCVSCGFCTDACPTGIPVAEIFSYMADITQPTFEYIAGKNNGEPLPLRKFEKKELPLVHEIVKSAEGEEGSDE